jgi:alpha-glucosidase
MSSEKSFTNKNTPWYRHSVIYQIYPWSFKDSNNDGIGDLRGIIQKLDYLNDGKHGLSSDSLGVGAIWISPIYPSPMKDFGYDISNYCDIDPIFGDMKVFDELVEKAHARGIKIIMDLVTNHTSDQHPWFLESRSSKDNPKRDWYIWHDPKPDGSVPNNWISVSGGSMWTLDKKTNQYYLHNFLPEQPDLNWRNKEVQAEMRKIFEFWIKRGVDGFRVDAASHFVEDSEFRDDPENKDYIHGVTNPYERFSHTFSTNQPEIKEVIGMMCDVAEQNQDIFIVSETYLGLEDIKRFYRFCETPVHAPFNFQLMSLPWSAQEFRKSIDEFDASLLPQDVPTYVLGNHDRTRVATQRGPKQARALALLTLTLRGTPFVYYGEEIGMQDVGIPKHALRDGFVRTSDGLFCRDAERTPMQWNDKENAGFSLHKPWLPVSKDYKEVNVEVEKGDTQSTLNLYKFLIHFRNSNQTLIDGKYKSFDAHSHDVFAYTRDSAKETLFVYINFSGVEVTELLPEGKHELICTTLLDVLPGKVVSNQIILRPYEACLLRHKRTKFELFKDLFPH